MNDKSLAQHYICPSHQASNKFLGKL
ncbi:hypothetical protein THIOKS12580016 [Thiocapsa sp. KS1]|nr:hypothetical protein THIOKS12580016 [Thiocapsa sp. KS1]